MDDFVNMVNSDEVRPKVPGTEAINYNAPQFSFGGRSVKDSGLAAAEQMEKDGRDMEDIRLETGWFRGYDKKWRFEIDDSKAVWNENYQLKGQQGYQSFKLGDVLQHEELYKYYPEMKELTVTVNPYLRTLGAVYGASEDNIVMREYEPGSSIWQESVIHELQHIIQHKEGFATGSSPEMFSYLDWGDKEYEALDRRIEIAGKLYNILRRHGIKISKEEIENNKYVSLGEYEDSIIKENYWLLSRLADENPRTEKLWNEYWEQVHILNATTPYGQYHNTAGEIEAFDSQFRSKLSAEERKNIRPDYMRTNVIFTGTNSASYYYVGKSEDGRSIYHTNYAKNTPKEDKQRKLISLVQNVWSKKPIRLSIIKDGEPINITASFNPELTTRSDLSKIVFGNRKGTASEKRITMNLSPDIYQIAADSQFTGEKAETGKQNPAHSNVTNWEYFVTNLIYEEDDGSKIDCYMNIDVKQNPDGYWFYSFGIEKGTAPQTLLAVVTEKNSATVPTDSIHAPDVLVNNENQYARRRDEGEYDWMDDNTVVMKIKLRSGYSGENRQTGD